MCLGVFRGDLSSCVRSWGCLKGRQQLKILLSSLRQKVRKKGEGWERGLLTLGKTQR